MACNRKLASSPAREEKFTKVGSFRDLREKRKREDAGVGPVITVVARAGEFGKRPHTRIRIKMTQAL